MLNCVGHSIHQVYVSGSSDGHQPSQADAQINIARILMSETGPILVLM